MSDDLGVRLGDEFVAFLGELMLQFGVILDDSIVHDDEIAAAIAVRMSILLSGAAMRGPARVADAVDAVDRGKTQRLFEVVEFAGRAANFQFAGLRDHGDAGGIVAAILEALQPIENDRHNFLRADVANYSAHGMFLLRRRAGAWENASPGPETSRAN